jgi:gliding motility-associated-like protein
MRTLTSLFFGLSISLSAIGQSSDCNTALSVCNSVYVEDNSPAGTGSVMEIAPGSCQTSGEFNSSWYVFTVQEDGDFSFILEPNDLNDDYDWSLFNITENGCAGINTGASPEVSCNSYGLFFGPQGATGISTAMGGSGNSNGPGDINGPIFNADVPVQAGEVYALVVMNYSATLNGYTLDFSSSDVPIFDEEPPTITGYTLDCNQSGVVFTLSESVVAAELIPANISFTLNGTNYPITGVVDFALPYANSFTVEIIGLNGQQGTGVFTFDGSISDVCGNPISLTYEVELPGNPQPVVTIEEACNGENGVITFEFLNAPDCHTFELNNNTVIGADCDGFTAENLAPGNYTITAINTTNNCESLLELEVTDIPLSIDVGIDQALCDMNTQLEAVFSGGTLNWNPQAELFFSSPNQALTSVSATTPGTYLISATVNSNGCTLTDDVEVTFNYPPELEISVVNQNCQGLCDGTVIVESLNQSITATLNGQTLVGDSVVFTGLCAGSYAPFVQFSEICFADYDVDVSLLSSLDVDFNADPWETDVQQTEINFSGIVSGADSIEWLIEPGGFTSNEESWSLELPALATNYTVQLFGFDDFGCIQYAEAQVLVRDAFHVFVPNAFTPDGDGVNEVFKPQFSYPPEDYEFRIFDRWGNTVFSSTNHEEGWIGNVDGGSYYTQADHYIWIMRAKGLGPDIQEFKGSVTVIR